MLTSLKEFDYDLPQELIAQYPLAKRDQARLLVVNRKTHQIQHDVFYNLSKYLPKKSLIVLNDSKVVPARLLSQRETGGEVEIFLLKKLEDGYTYEVLLRPLKRLKVGEVISFLDGKVKAEIIDKINPRIRFNAKNLSKYLSKIGHMPLPPYIQRQDDSSDQRNYQTVFAKHAGSVAAPTAGLHFTKSLMNRLQKEGHSFEKVTLHVNYGTFKPVEEEDITQHKIHFEDYELKKNAYTKILSTRKKEQAVVATGTTSCRVLETVAIHGKLCGSTNLFIYPKYQFKLTDILVTNFHLPRSTLLMLVYAFGSKELMKKAYQEAIKEKYRFYSYGDAMIII